MVNSMLRKYRGISAECMECLNKDVKNKKIKKKGQILYIMRRDNQITINAKLFDITHKSYGFTADQIEAIN